MEAIPFYSADLIKKLQEETPERCPDISWTEREIWIYKGKRDLINSLAMLQKAHEDNILEN